MKSVRKVPLCSRLPQSLSTVKLTWSPITQQSGLLGLLRTAANEWGAYGIRINAVCPRLIRTRLTASSFSNPSIIWEYFKHIPLGRGGEPEEVPPAVMFSASDLACYIPKTMLVVDGGQMAPKFGLWGNEADIFDSQGWIRSACRSSASIPIQTTRISLLAALALLARLGHDIIIVTLSAGDCGSTVHGQTRLPPSKEPRLPSPQC